MLNVLLIERPVMYKLLLSFHQRMLSSTIQVTSTGYFCHFIYIMRYAAIHVEQNTYMCKRGKTRENIWRNYDPYRRGLLALSTCSLIDVVLCYIFLDFFRIICYWVFISTLKKEREYSNNHSTLCYEGNTEEYIILGIWQLMGFLNLKEILFFLVVGYLIIRKDILLC